VGWQAGEAPPQSTSAAQPRQACVVVLQTGVVLPHCAFDTHGTHVPVVVKQTGEAPPQDVAFVAEHWAHAPLAWQAGVAPPQSPSPAQARQVCVAPLQIGVVPAQSALARQVTHVPLVV